MVIQKFLMKLQNNIITLYLKNEYVFHYISASCL